MTTPNKYANMSRDFMARAEAYLQQGDLVQASGKSWDAAACALKSIAEQRGWQHQSLYLLHDLSVQFADELGRPDLYDKFAVAMSMYRNIYDQWEPEDSVEYALDRIKKYLAELEAVSPQLPASYVVETHAQRRRLERLTGQRPPHDTPSEEGT